jgi:hypothetical protein
MAEVVELVPKGTLDRLEKLNTKVGRTAGARRVRVAHTAKAKTEADLDPGQMEERIPASGEVVTTESTGGVPDPVDRKANQTVEISPECQVPIASAPPAAECLDLFQIGDGCVVIVWRLEKVDDWTAPILGAACKEILGKKRIQKVVFDLSGVD